jgi:hypothetical protein
MDDSYGRLKGLPNQMGGVLVAFSGGVVALCLLQRPINPDEELRTLLGLVARTRTPEMA